MIKKIAKRFLSFMLTVLMVFSLLPASALTAYAAGGTSLEGLAEGIGAEYAGTGTYSWTAVGTDRINGSATGKKTSCDSSSSTTTLTITNNKANVAKLSFDYTLALNGGTITIDGTNVTAKGTFEKEVAVGASISIVLTSAKEASSTTISISNLLMLVDIDATTTFQPAENGSYTVDGTEITEEMVKTQSSTIPYSLKATPAEGYKFSGWYSVTENEYLSSDAEATFNFEKNQTITAKFVPMEAPVFEVDSARFTDLDEANRYAVENRIDKITLISDGTLPAGDYTIASGITLLIPFDEAGTCYTTTPAPVDGGWTYKTPEPFRTLTMAANSSITVDGALSVSAKHAHSMELAAGGAPSGPCGFIKMEEGSAITVNNDGAAYVYGFVIGDGTVTAKSRAIIYENFQIADFRGGSATLAMNGKGVFPFSQYYVQNIEVPLTLEFGAEEYVYTSLYASSKPNSTSIKFIGSNGAMFNLEEGASITKKYLPGKDRLEISVNGGLNVSNLSLSVGGASVNSKDYVFPISNNITINVQSGTTTIKQKLALLAGVELNIAEGAELNVASGADIFVYDSDEWLKNNYVRDSWKFVASKHSPTRTYTRSIDDLIDAKMDINGTLSVEGGIYTTESGADVISSNGTGSVKFISNPGTAAKTQQVTQSGSKVTFIDIPVNSIWLHNDGANVGTETEYTTTQEAENDWVYTYNTTTETWETKNTPTTVTVTFDANGGEGTMEPQAITSRGNLTKNAFTNGDYVFGGWNTAADGTGVSYADEELVNLREDTTLYAVWLHTVTWVNWDGTVLKTENLKDGTTPEYTGTPRRTQDAQYSYTFKGWDPEVKPVDGNITYTATYTETLRKYTVYWKNGTTTLETDTQIPYGTIPTYDGAEPTKAADADGEYIFTGWSPEVGPITGSTTYTAQFKLKTNGYTVTWINDDGTVLETDEQVPEGTVPTYDGEEPTKEADAQYTYTFEGWEPEVAAVTADVTYKATYSKTVNSYTITWVDEDDFVLSEDTVPYGEVPEYTGDVPAKDGDAEYSYVFSGWMPEVVPVSVDATYKVVFTEQKNTYTVIWQNADGTILETDENVAYGETPVYDGAAPAKEADEQFSYTFKGWTPAVDTVTGDITYTAVYEEVINQYTVTWQNADGSLLKSETMDYGATPAYSGETPAKEADAQYTYTFAGWDPEISSVTGNVTYTAVYTETLNTYTITWVDEDGITVLSTDTVAYGKVPVYSGETPVKESDDQYTYTFSGWTPKVVAVTENATYTAVYEATANQYTVIWQDEDGTVLETDENVPYGTLPTYDKEKPVKEADEQYTYTFTGWDKEISAVTKDVTYTAVYTQALRTYTVTWTNDDGTILETDEKVPYGTTPTYDGETPVKTADEHCTYTFTGWTPEISEVTGNITYIAAFEAQGEIHTVTFDANGGEGTMEAQSFEYGVDQQLIPNTFKRDGYKFLGWNTKADGTGADYADEGSIGFLTEDITLYAKWQFWNGWLNDETGTTYIADGEKAYFETWKTIEEKTYYFDENGYVVKGVYETMSQDNSYTAMFVFDTTTGEFLRNQNGLFDVGTDTYWTESGEVVVYAGLVRVVKDDGEICYYYFGEDNKAVKATADTKQYTVEKNNGLALPEGNKYTFDENGVIVHFDSSINGIHFDEASSAYYYCVDGVIIADGLMKIDGFYYYARTSTGAFVRSCNYWITRTHGLLEEGIYTFDDMGKIVFPEEIEKKNGIVEENGSLYYYVDGELCGAGLIQMDGDYYYVRTSTGEVVHGKTYWVTSTNDLLPSGLYEFADDGKMLNPPEVDPDPELKNGIVAEDGSLYYYVDGVRTGAGLIQIDGDYYYVRTSSGEVIHGRKYWVTATNNLLPSGQYVFDDNGKMIIE